MALIRTEAVAVTDPEQIEPVTADPRDDYLVALAIRERADALISGDRYLTELDLEELTVLTPAQALAPLDETG